MPRIAIVGSCITRDLWPVRGGGAEALLYVCRTSLPSLLSQAVPGFQPSQEPPAGLRQNQHNALVADLQKTALRRLIDYKPTHVIFDFIDERFDLVWVGGSIATKSAELAWSGYLEQPALAGLRTIPRLSPACARLWLETAAEFAAIVRATPLGDAQLILHSARWATEQRDARGGLRAIEQVEVMPGEPAEIADYNALLAQQEADFQALMPPMMHIDAGALRLADPGHHWGLSPFHYIPEYYDEARRQLAAMGLAAAFSARLCEPSAPAA